MARATALPRQPAAACRCSQLAAAAVTPLQPRVPNSPSPGIQPARGRRASSSTGAQGAPWSNRLELRLLARARLHPALLRLPGPDAAKIALATGRPIAGGSLRRGRRHESRPSPLSLSSATSLSGCVVRRLLVPAPCSSCRPTSLPPAPNSPPRSRSSPASSLPMTLLYSTSIYSGLSVGHNIYCICSSSISSRMLGLLNEELEEADESHGFLNGDIENCDISTLISDERKKDKTNKMVSYYEQIVNEKRARFWGQRMQICGDCHLAIKVMSAVKNQEIIARDKH